MSAPPDPSSFTFEPLFALLGLVATVVYVRAARIHRPGGWRIASFAAGIALIVLSVNSPLETLAVHYLLMAHLAQNALMVPAGYKSNDEIKAFTNYVGAPGFTLKSLRAMAPRGCVQERTNCVMSSNADGARS